MAKIRKSPAHLLRVGTVYLFRYSIPRQYQYFVSGEVGLSLGSWSLKDARLKAARLKRLNRKDGALFGIGKTRRRKEFEKLKKMILGAPDEDAVNSFAASIILTLREFNTRYGSVDKWVSLKKSHKEWNSFLEALLHASQTQANETLDTPEDRNNFASSLSTYLLMCYFDALASGKEKKLVAEMSNFIQVYAKIGREMDSGT